MVKAQNTAKPPYIDHREIEFAIAHEQEKGIYDPTQMRDLAIILRGLWDKEPELKAQCMRDMCRAALKRLDEPLKIGDIEINSPELLLSIGVPWTDAIATTHWPTDDIAREFEALLAKTGAKAEGDKGLSIFYQKGMIPYLAEDVLTYWQERYQRFRAWNIATYNGTQPPDDALTPEEISADDILGFTMFGTWHPDELKITGMNPQDKDPDARWEQAWGGGEVMPFADYYRNSIRWHVNGGVPGAENLPPTGFNQQMRDHIYAHRALCCRDEIPIDVREAIVSGQAGYASFVQQQARFFERMTAYGREYNNALNEAQEGFTPILSEGGIQAKKDIATIVKNGELQPTLYTTEKQSKHWTPLHALIHNGFDEQVQSLLKRGVDWTPIKASSPSDGQLGMVSIGLEAIQQCSLHTMHALEKAGYLFSAHVGSRMASTYAVDYKSLEKLKFLNERGFHLCENARGSDRSLLEHALHRWDDTPQERPALLKLFLENGGARVLKREGQDGFFDLHAIKGKVVRRYDPEPNNADYQAIKGHYDTQLVRLEQFKRNAEAIITGDTMPYPRAPNPHTLSIADIVGFHSIGELGEVQKPSYWIGDFESLDALPERVEGDHRVSRNFDKGIQNILNQQTLDRAALLSQYCPQKHIAAWSADVVPPQAERARG